MGDNNKQMPLVALVGRPNVGKSLLFNRLVRKSFSIVADIPGVTRDRIYAETKIEVGAKDWKIALVDTGGLEPNSEQPLSRRIYEQTELAVDEADLIVWVTDGRSGIHPEEQAIAARLRRTHKPIVVAVNKIDNSDREGDAAEFYGLGFSDVLPISAAHNRNVGELEEIIVDRLEATGFSADENAPAHDDESAHDDEAVHDDESSESASSRKISVAVPDRVAVAVIGRPNVGKSSLVNRLLGEDRHVVSPIAGTTMDAVDSVVQFKDTAIVMIDTAGIRRKRSIAMRLEQFSVVAALRALDRSDVALLIIDATQPIAHQDAKISSFAGEKGKAVIIVVSKWDQSQQNQRNFLEVLRRELGHLAFAPVLFTSSHTGEGIDRIFPEVLQVHRQYGHRVGTGELNRFVETVLAEQPPAKRGKVGRIYYITQAGTRPPRFVASVNDPARFHLSYRRFLNNELRRSFGFGAVPLFIAFRGHHAKEEESEKRQPSREKGRLDVQRDPRKQATKQKRKAKALKMKKR